MQTPMFLTANNKYSKNSKQTPIKNKGFALPAAIFLLVVLSMMAVGLLMINKYSSKNSTLDTLDVKAYFAAKAGLEYGLYQAGKIGSCSSTPQTMTVPDSSYNGFKATYTCSSLTSDEAGIITTYYKVVAVGCYTQTASCPETSAKPSSDDYVEKSVTGVLAK